MTKKKSNAYIGRGERDGVHVMKVGKSNDTQRRGRELCITVGGTVKCFDEKKAFYIESLLRQFVIEKGGIRYEETLDWFHFDEQIYEMLREYLRKHKSNLAQEDELVQFIRRYYEIIIAELMTENASLQDTHNTILEEIKVLKAQQEKQKEELQKERERSEQIVKQERTHSQEQLERLLREIAELRYKMGQLEKGDDS